MKSQTEGAGRVGLVLVLGVLLLPAAAWAQTGSIAGVVRDTSGAVLPGVTVEAASPALIEKVRAVVTNDRGAYTIIDLRPGTYTVTFTLPGFAIVKREGLELAAGFTAPADAELRVGSLEETITVTGATPIVDVQNVRTQNTLTRSQLDILPTAQTVGSFSALTLGSVASGVQAGADVGGNTGEQGVVSIHGGRANDMKYMQDGMTTANARGAAGGINKAGHNINQLAIAEVQVSYNGGNAEYETAGAQFNFVTKDGGNLFSGAGRMAYTDNTFQSTAITDDLRARGVTSSQSVKNIYDYGGALGGPLRQNKLWFFTAHRRWGSNLIQPNSFYNAVQGTGRYVPDLDRPGYINSDTGEYGGRLTFQATQKTKIGYYFSHSTTCACFLGTGSTQAPEAGMMNDIPAWTNQISVTRVQTPKLMFEAGFTDVPAIWYFPHADGAGPNDIPMLEASTGFAWNARASQVLNYTDLPPVAGVPDHSTGGQRNARSAASYVTGSHNVKVGWMWQHGELTEAGQNNSLAGFGPISIRLLNGVPNQITQWMSPTYQSQFFNSTGLYVQDQWSFGGRMTINVGVRADFYEGYYPDQRIPAQTFAGEVFIPGRREVGHYQDISPRVGLAYKVTADGRTALKVSMGRYVGGQGAGTPQLVNPANTIVRQATRTWTDANADMFPQASELGPLSNAAFGTPVPNTTFTDEVLQANRLYTWQSSVVLERELLPKVGLTVGYFRVRHYNFSVTENTAVRPADHDPYCVTAPVDPRLPGGGGNQICGFFNVTPALFGRVNNVVRLADTFGEQSETFNGVDMSVNARFNNGALLQGGLAVGQTVTDRCFVVSSPQELYQCRQVRPWWNGGGQVKFSGAYPLPAGFHVSAVYQNIQGTPVQANTLFTSAQVAGSLGRNLAGCAATGPCNQTVTNALIEPFTVFEDRVNQLDVRLGKTLSFGRVKAVPSFDVYNLFNAHPVLRRNDTYGSAWGTPTQFLDGRLAKFSMQLDF